MRAIKLLFGVVLFTLAVGALQTDQMLCGAGSGGSGACPWSTGGGQLCCSSSGTCGDTVQFCGKGCQYRYGRCYPLQPLVSPGDPVLDQVSPPSEAPRVRPLALSPSIAASPEPSPKQPQQTPALPRYQEVNVMGASDVTVYGRRMLISA